MKAKKPFYGSDKKREKFQPVTSQLYDHITFADGSLSGHFFG